MQILMKEYGESVAAAFFTVAVLGIFAAMFLSDGGAFHSFFTSFCGYLL